MHRGFLVHQRRPIKAWIVALMIVATMAMFFFVGQGYQSYELDHVKLEREALQARVAELEDRTRRLVQENAHLAGMARVERDAYELANEELARLQQELLKQKEELVFYQGIVSPGDTSLGVNLQSFEVRKRNIGNQYSYKLILTKRGKSTNKVAGGADVIIRGEDQNGLAEHRIADLDLEKAGKDTKFAFRYFQVFEGNIALPEGFEPYEVEIGIKPTTKKVKSFSETISWAQLLSEGV